MDFIELRGVTRAYRYGNQESVILHGIDLHIARGEMVAIVGASGSGKSTLMNIIGGLDRADSGQVWIDGEELAQLSALELSRLRREKIGFIFQRYHLLADLSSAENVALPALYAGRPQREQRAAALLARLGLEQRAQHRPSQLSGGQQQRVSIARALMNGGALILADEPTGALDSQSGAEVMAILRELHQAGHTVVIVTHDAHIAQQAPRIIEIADGRIVSDRAITAEHSSTPPAPPPLPSATFSGRVARFWAALAMASRAIWGHKLRSFLTMLGIVIGIASVVSVVALGQGAQQKILAQIHNLSNHSILIFSGRDDSATTPQPLTAEDAQVLAALPFVAGTSPENGGSFALSWGKVSRQAVVNGVGADFFQIQGQRPLQLGRMFTPAERLQSAPVVLLDARSAQRLMKESNPIGAVVTVGKMVARVIGVVANDPNARPAPQLQLFTPYTTVAHRLLGRDAMNAITVRIKEGVRTATAEDAIERVLSRRHGQKDFSLFNTDRFRQTVEKTTETLSLLIASIALIALVVGGIGVMNIMLVSVTERTAEIGVRMAIGARQGDILRQFLIESVLLCLLGGVLGIGLAFALGWLMASLGAPIAMIYSAKAIWAAFGCATGIGVLFGFLPARRAAKLSPVQALAAGA